MSQEIERGAAKSSLYTTQYNGTLQDFRHREKNSADQLGPVLQWHTKKSPPLGKGGGPYDCNVQGMSLLIGVIGISELFPIYDTTALAVAIITAEGLIAGHYRMRYAVIEFPGNEGCFLVFLLVFPHFLKRRFSVFISVCRANLRDSDNIVKSTLPAFDKPSEGNLVKGVDFCHKIGCSENGEVTQLFSDIPLILRNPTWLSRFGYRLSVFRELVPASALEGLSRSRAGMTGNARYFCNMIAVENIAFVNPAVGLFLMAFDARKGPFRRVLGCVDCVSLGKLMITVLIRESLVAIVASHANGHVHIVFFVNDIPPLEPSI